MDNADAGLEPGTRGGGMSRDDDDEMLLADGCLARLVRDAGGAILRDIGFVTTVCGSSTTSDNDVYAVSLMGMID